MIVQLDHRTNDLAGLGKFSLLRALTPPKAVRSLVTSAIQAVGVKATIPTPAGPITVDSRDPNALKNAAAAIKDAISKGTVTVGARQPQDQPSPADQARGYVENNIPGGWLTVGAAAAGGLFLLSQAMKKKGKRD